MTIPATVLKVLDALNIEYEATDHDESLCLMKSPINGYSANIARMVFLEDALGQLQVIIPCNYSDLNLLNYVTDANCRPYPAMRLINSKTSFNSMSFRPCRKSPKLIPL